MGVVRPHERERIPLLDIFVDADSCPVKPEVYRVAKRYQLAVNLVANSWMQIPDDPSITLEVVKGGFDAADDWIVDHVKPGDIVITADILLASRCVKADVSVIGPTGRQFTEDNIGNAVATRNLMEELRGAGEQTRGPAPMRQRDRSSFLQKLDEVIQRVQRKKNKKKQL